MNKGTKIGHKGYSFNSDGDHDIDLSNYKPPSEDEYNEMFDDSSYSFIQIHKGVMYGVNKLKFGNRRFTLLEPNPVSFYFSVAFDTSQQVKDAYARLDSSLLKANGSWPLSVSFSYLFRVKAISIIFAFSSCEAFLNQTFPDYENMFLSNGKTCSKREAEWYKFEKKVEAVSFYLKKDFTKMQPNKYKKLKELRDLRNELIHLKEVKQGVTSYNDIYQLIIDVDLDKIISAVKSFINFYKPKTIINYAH